MKDKLASGDILIYRPALVGRRRLTQKLADYSDLAKLRLSLLVLFSALIGFFLGWNGPAPLGLLFYFAAGTFLVIAGANALNQVLERAYDALMARTAHRPLPAERMGVAEARWAALAMSCAGWLLLMMMVNLRTGLLAALALAVYLLVYTPLKRRSVWNTAFGAISGAIPPMMGWTAARNEFGAPAWVLFAILFFWQFPHFWAIAWMYRDEYAGAGFRMLPVVDPNGRRTGRQAILFSLALLGVSLMPALWHMTSMVSLFGALGLGSLLCGFSWRLWAQRTPAAARDLMLASVVYLPALLILMLLTKI